ncbi:flavin-containing monooxygenase [Nocardia amamiensis]|uniref:flavin-containing monooxygenase n=1 Tax=Nocardia amamiensis TaxID=404578 RepID=UPI000A036D65|nr:NAD(P)/FAD-dependent oxidoreductase [Nocardia amamiensis]
MTLTAARSPAAAIPRASSLPHHQAVIVGAGFGGLTMGAELKAAGIHDFVILEEGADVGGVWRENTYPGCACDVPSHLYSFAFDPYRDPRIRYPGQPDILAYMQTVAERQGLREHLRTTTAVTAADYDDAAGVWTLTTADGARLRAGAVIWAVGQLHRPAMPSIPGLDAFGGRAFHSARWNHNVDLTGHIAVIGTGSSGTQIVPELARTAASVTVYQRTPAWILPRPRERFGPLTRWALEHVPGLHQLYRAGLHQGADLTLAPIMHGGWSARPATWVARAHLRRQVADPALRGELTPRYRIGEKRILLDSKFYPALRLPHVELVTDPIERIAVDGIRTTDGTHRPADVIVLATGFKAPEFLGGIEIRGRGGADLHRQWASTGGPEAYLGLAVPGFPGMFMIAGPHSFTPAHSNPAIKASQARYIARCLEHSTALGAPLEVSASAMTAYRRWLDGALASTVWPDGVASWFKQSDGVITNPWPASVKRFDRMTRLGPEHIFVPVPTSRTAAVTARRSA